MSKDVISIYPIAEKILYLREQKSILDRDLARLYAVQTRVLNQAVKRNSDRFSADFAFALSRAEIERISQFVISSSTLRFSKQVRAFTEEGVAMLSSLWTGERTRLACNRQSGSDRWRPRHRELFRPLFLDEFEIELKEGFSARRRKEHARRVCSPE
jgi:hypothetical protein